MKNLFPMQHLKRVENWAYGLRHRILIKLLISLRKHLPEGFALVEAHGHVGRAVFFPKTIDLEKRRVRKLRQHFCFVNEAA